MVKNETITSTIDRKKLTETQAKVNANADLVNQVVRRVVGEYCGELDAYMRFIKSILDSATPPSPEELDDFTLNLPVLIYFASEAQETLGIKEDVAKAIKMELFNTVMSEQDGTVEAKKAAAQLQIQYEHLTYLVYSGAYKKIKERVAAAYEMINSVKKVTSRRMQEYEIARDSVNKFRKDIQ